MVLLLEVQFASHLRNLFLDPVFFLFLLFQPLCMSLSLQVLHGHGVVPKWFLNVRKVCLVRDDLLPVGISPHEGWR